MQARLEEMHGRLEIYRYRQLWAKELSCVRTFRMRLGSSGRRRRATQEELLVTGVVACLVFLGNGFREIYQ